MHHNFFIHSSIEEHLDYFQIMGIMNQATMTLIKHTSFGMMKSPLGTCPRVVYLDLKLDRFPPNLKPAIHIDFHSCCTNLLSHQ